MTIDVVKTGIDGKMYTFEFETIQSAMNNIELMKKDSYTKCIDITYFERVYNKENLR